MDMHFLQTLEKKPGPEQIWRYVEVIFENIEYGIKIVLENMTLNILKILNSGWIQKQKMEMWYYGFNIVSNNMKWF